MSKTNWHRPSFQTRSRLTESVAGDDLPPDLRPPRKPRPSKADLRAEAERAVVEFEARQAKRQQPAALGARRRPAKAREF